MFHKGRAEPRAREVRADQPGHQEARRRALRHGPALSVREGAGDDVNRSTDDGSTDGGRLLVAVMRSGAKATSML